MAEPCGLVITGGQLPIYANREKEERVYTCCNESVRLDDEMTKKTVLTECYMTKTSGSPAYPVGIPSQFNPEVMWWDFRRTSGIPCVLHY